MTCTPAGGFAAACVAGLKQALNASYAWDTATASDSFSVSLAKVPAAQSQCVRVGTALDTASISYKHRDGHIHARVHSADGEQPGMP